jgi:hypothetical protein
MQTKSELAAETLKATPPAAVAGLTLMGVSLNDVVLIATLVYLSVQIAFLVYKWIKLHRGSNDNE